VSENSKIEWTDHTFNPWIGCTKVSPGCDHCYAERDMADRLKVVQWGPHGARVRTKPANWAKPMAWNRRHDEFFARHGRRQRVFCASLADVFDNGVDPAWRADLFALIHQTPNLDWLLLTKRIGNAHQMIGEALITMTGDTALLPSWPWPNVWIGASIVNQEEADRDIPKLLQVPARVRFLSMEPLLGPVDLRQAHVAPVRLPRVDWVIVGGESGPAARPIHPDWARDLRDQCAAAGVPFLFKQWGEWVPRGPESMGYPIIDDVPRRRITDAGDNGQDLGAEGGNDVWMQRAGKKIAGRQLDGAQHDGYPSAKSGTF
jgi:protein gp37